MLGGPRLTYVKKLATVQLNLLVKVYDEYERNFSYRVGLCNSFQLLIDTDFIANHQ